MTDSTKMLTALVRLRGVLQEAGLPLDLPDAEEHRLAREQMVDQLADYVIPRIMTLEAPLLAVVGGSTGAGKSTLVNSLVGERVTTPGVLRPTTRSPVLVHHPADGLWFGQDRVLPDLRRTTSSTDDQSALQLVPSTQMPEGLALIDAPDVDSVEARNRTLAAQLLAAADLWLFVTSAARYADQVPWEFLKRAAERSTAVAIVLDRTHEDATETITTHLARMLAARGLKDSPLFVVPEGKVDEDGLLAPSVVSDIRGWLEALAADAEARTAVVRQTLEGAIRTVSRRTYDVADAVETQLSAARELRAEADRSYERALRDVRTAAADGTLLRGELLALWQEFVGTGELLKTLESRVGAFRDRLVGVVRGKPAQVDRVTDAVGSGLVTLLLEHAEEAAERAAGAWRANPSGERLLAGEAVQLERASRDLRRRAEQLVRDWQDDVLELVRHEGADKRMTARFLAYGVNGLSAALAVVVFAEGAGLPAAELGRSLLEAVFGGEAVRRLVDAARGELDRRVAELFAGEHARYGAVLDDLGLHAEAAEQLRAAARRVDDLRFAQNRPTDGDL